MELKPQLGIHMPKTHANCPFLGFVMLCGMVYILPPLFRFVIDLYCPNSNPLYEVTYQIKKVKDLYGSL
jgi:hypothetical protein